MTTQVISFLRRLPTGEVIGEHPLDLPVRSLPTKAVWWTIPADLLAWGVTEAAIPGAAHAAEHAAIGMLPLVARSDRWDIGGVSTALHPDTGLPTILVYDGYPEEPASPSAGPARWSSGSPGPVPRSPVVTARRDARPASSRRSVATATNPWTRLGP